jgi:hypothetical protein
MTSWSLRGQNISAAKLAMYITKKAAQWFNIGSADEMLTVVLELLKENQIR